MTDKARYIYRLDDAGSKEIAMVGGKAANLGRLFGILGVRVPHGFCITTDAFRRILAAAAVDDFIAQLTLLKPGERERIGEISSKIREAIMATPIPHDIAGSITDSLSSLGEKTAYAVRSSATAEDLPAASFAGQQDSFLNIIGTDAVLYHVRKCWASLFTDRAIIYRLQNGFSQHAVHLAVIVQTMVFPKASGILFTADPVSSDRKQLSIDAGYGLGEAIVSGIVNTDTYKVRSGNLVYKKIPTKKLAVQALGEGGTKEQEVSAEDRQKQVLTDEQILELEHIGRTIENYFGTPQDIEWCLADDGFYMVQSRPITTLYPIPARPGSSENDNASGQRNRVYLSVGHQQMMTDAMKPLGLSVWQLSVARPMHEAGGRLFIDVTEELATPQRRPAFLNMVGMSHPLLKNALVKLLDRKDFIKIAENGEELPHQKAYKPIDFQTLKDYEPAIVSDLIDRSEASILKLKQDIQDKKGAALFDFILEDIGTLRKQISDPKSIGVIMTSMNAANWINEKMKLWLGEANAADVLSQSVPNNITSEMGLALLDVADAIRPYPGIIRYLELVKEEDFLKQLPRYDGGQEVAGIINAYLDKYGMRCAGEIDITKTRWSEAPATLLPIILSNIKNFKPGASRVKFDQGLQRALKKEQELLARLKALPDGAQKAAETKRMIDLLRNLAGYREYPKYGLVSRYFLYKQALLKEAERLVKANVIREKEAIYYLRFEELHNLVRGGEIDYAVINNRKEAYRLFKKLTPPGVITSDGEIVTGEYDRKDLPAGAIAGTAVSSGIVEGRARVILNLNEADLEADDILVTRFTDPSWTPLFVSVKGLVTEVGGLMTHGAVIAREYGLPAVVGVEHATTLIRDGQRIRINGTEGYVEIL